MPDKDVDEQFAAIMAHWDDVALGIDPFGDPLAEDGDGTSPVDTTPDTTPGGTAATEVDVSDVSGVPRVPDRSSDTEASPLSDTAPSAAAAAPPTAATPPPTAPTPAPRAAPPAGRKPPGPATAPPPLPDDDAPPLIGAGWRQHDPPDVEEHFVPPPPAPLPSADDKHFWLMMVGLIGGPLLFLYLILFARDGNGWWMMFALSMAIAGFVLLVLRQPSERDENDDGVRL